MSSSFARDPMPTVIRQDAKIIGCICLPEEDVLDFIDEFNHCYGPLGMHIETPQSTFPLSASNLLPVGATTQRNWRVPRFPKFDSVDHSTRALLPEPTPNTPNSPAPGAIFD